jgi:hypothetical protein
MLKMKQSINEIHVTRTSTVFHWEPMRSILERLTAVILMVIILVTTAKFCDSFNSLQITFTCSFIVKKKYGFSKLDWF